MPARDPEQVALDFVRRINLHDVDAITAMMGPGFRFVDSLGHEVKGVARMREGWGSYFALFPDYRISIREHFRHGSTVALFGTARGGRAKSTRNRSRGRWMIPAAWRAVVRRGRVVHWQVYADNTPVAKILGR